MMSMTVMVHAGFGEDLAGDACADEYHDDAGGDDGGADGGGSGDDNDRKDIALSSS